MFKCPAVQMAGPAGPFQGVGEAHARGPNRPEPIPLPHLVGAYSHHPAAVQYHMKSLVEVVGVVFGPLKYGAVHRSDDAVVSTALNRGPIAPSEVARHRANVGIGHAAGQEG